MKKIFTITASACVSLASYAQYDPEALAVLDAMSEKYKKVEAFKASFTQTLTNKEVDLNESLSGEMTVKGDKYVLDVAGQRIFNNGQDIYTYSEEIAEVTISPNDTEESEINIVNIYDIYKEGFKYALISKLPNGDRIVELDPKSRDKSYFKITMVINGQNELKSFILYEKTNNIYIYSVDSFDEISVNDNFFTFDASKYPNVEVIDFR